MKYVCLEMGEIISLLLCIRKRAYAIHFMSSPIRSHLELFNAGKVYLSYFYGLVKQLSAQVHVDIYYEKFAHHSQAARTDDFQWKTVQTYECFAYFLFFYLIISAWPGNWFKRCINSLMRWFVCVFVSFHLFHVLWNWHTLMRSREIARDIND